MVKPATAARGVGIAATSLPSTLAAFRGAAGGDRVAQAMITHPATYKGRKFDLRVLVAVRSFSPPSAALYKRWHARVAESQHDASAVAARGSLVTVSCYDEADGRTAQTMLARSDVDAALAERGWCAKSLERAIAALAAALVCAGGGAIGAWPRAGAWYGLDVMLDESVLMGGDNGGAYPSPRLLEQNYAPDLATTASYRPEVAGELLAAVFGGATAGSGLDGEAWTELF